jgi:uncharacterized protein (TIGR03000 family)
MGLQKAMCGLIVAVAAVTFAAQDARAYWGHGGWGSWGGSWGGCGSCGWGGDGWGGYGGGWGGYSGDYGGYGYGGGRWGGGRWGGYDGYGYGGYGGGGYSGGCGCCGSSDGEGVSVGGSGGEVAPAATKLTLHVPAEARVTLAGVATKQTGEVRLFSTRQLAAGQAWPNYTVHVELVRDGKTLTQDRQIALTGGTAQELSIDFGSSQLAGM